MRRGPRRNVTVAPTNGTERFAMSTTASLSSASPSRRNSGRLLVVGSALVATGGILGLAGMAVGTAAFVAASRRRFEQLGIPPGEFARVQLARARAATGAGIGAWRGQPDPARARGNARRVPEPENARIE